METEEAFSRLVRSRQSVRSFRPDPVPDDVIASVLSDAQHSPSNCNTQPWHVHVVSGGSRDAVSAAMLAAQVEGRTTPDFSFEKGDFYGIYRERLRAQGAAYYQALGVERDAMQDRRTTSLRNLAFFDAPHAAFLFMPALGDCVRAAADVGMYGQTLLLSLAAHGLGGVPQTMLGMYAGTIRKVLGIDPAFRMLFGISFGYPDWTASANAFRIGKVPVEQSVTLHR